MAHGKFATAINCMDGRTQLPVNEWMRSTHAVDYVDTITEPGPVRILAEARDAAAVDSIRRRLEISVKKHGSTRVAIVAHADCAGNPVEKNVQLDQLRRAAATLLGWDLDIKVDLLWVGGDWQIQSVG